MTRLSKREQQLADYRDEVGPQKAPKSPRQVNAEWRSTVNHAKDEASNDDAAKIIEQQIQANLNTIVDSGNPLMDMF